MSSIRNPNRRIVRTLYKCLIRNANQLENRIAGHYLAIQELHQQGSNNISIVSSAGVSNPAPAFSNVNFDRVINKHLAAIHTEFIHKLELEPSTNDNNNNNNTTTYTMHRLWKQLPEGSRLHLNSAVRHYFKLHANDANNVDSHIDKGFEALRLVNARLKMMQNKSKSDEVLFSVGQVFVHKKYGYRGVIFGWDEECKESEAWIRKMGIDNLTNGRYQPFYRVLVDSRDKPGHATTYVAQENIQLVNEENEFTDIQLPPSATATATTTAATATATATAATTTTSSTTTSTTTSSTNNNVQDVQHPYIQKLFSGFENGRYIPKDKLRVLYPFDL